MSHTISALQPLIQNIEQALSQQHLPTEIIAGLLPDFKQLLQDSAWLPSAFKQPHPDYYQQYALYIDPEDRFSIVSFVWGAGQKTPIHNHEVWGVIGVLEGAEISTAFQHTDAGFQAEVTPTRLNVGDVDWFHPETGDIHAVNNAYDDQTSISIHIYGANIGKVERFTYQLDGTAKAFISGYSNAADL